MQFNLKRLKAERIARGLTPDDMGKVIGMEGNSYRRIENGTRKLSVDNFALILGKLDIRNEDILLFFNNSVDKMEQ